MRSESFPPSPRANHAICRGNEEKVETAGIEPAQDSPRPGEVYVELVPAAADHSRPRIDLIQAAGRCTCGAFPIGLTTTSPGEQW